MEDGRLIASQIISNSQTIFHPHARFNQVRLELQQPCDKPEPSRIPLSRLFQEFNFEHDSGGTVDRGEEQMLQGPLQYYRGVNSEVLRTLRRLHGNETKEHLA